MDEATAGFLEALNRLGGDLLDEGRLHEAERAFLRVLEGAREWPVPWYSLGLVYKRMRRWEPCARCSLAAAELDPGGGAAWWNVGIAATALERWDQARRAWRACGMEVPDGGGPPEMKMGIVPIRLAANAEVVWCERIDPARAIVRNVPLPESARHAGDLLLHDGEPDGYRVRAGVQVPVFNEIQLLRASGASTFEAAVTAPSPEDVRDLCALAVQRGVHAEDWTASVQRLCDACSRGAPHEHADEGEWAERKPDRRIGVSAPGEAAAVALMECWSAGGGGRTLRSLTCVLPA